MGDWIGLGVFLLILVGAFLGLAHLGRRPEPMSAEEFERRAQEGSGSMTAGAAAGLHALQKLMNPKAAEAVEVQKDLKAGFYDEHEQAGDGDGPGAGESDPAGPNSDEAIGGKGTDA